MSNLVLVPYDPIRHNRRSIRLPDHDYRLPGTYFVTICTENRAMLFDDPAWAALADSHWWELPTHFPEIDLGKWVVMPNHVHGLITIVDGGYDERTRQASSVQLQRPPRPTLDGRRRVLPKRQGKGSLSTVVGSYKSGVSREVNRLRHTPGAPVWQKGYYERIVRTEEEYNRVAFYILSNPEKWATDRDNPNGTPDKDEIEFWAKMGRPD